MIEIITNIDWVEFWTLFRNLSAAIVIVVVIISLLNIMLRRKYNKGVSRCKGSGVRSVYCYDCELDNKCPY